MFRAGFIAAEVEGFGDRVDLCFDLFLKVLQDLIELIEAILVVGVLAHNVEGTVAIDNLGGVLDELLAGLVNALVVEEGVVVVDGLVHLDVDLRGIGHRFVKGGGAAQLVLVLALGGGFVVVY